MATPTYCCGFECGAAFGSGSHWSNATGTIPTYQTTTVRTGLRAMKFLPAATQSYIDNNNIAAVNVARFYLRFTTLPNANTYIGSVSVGGISWGAAYKTDGKIYAASGTAITAGATGITVTTGVWYRIDMLVNPPAGTVDVQVDGAACGQRTTTAGSGSSSFYLGNISACTAEFYVDDVLTSATSADYPLGAGQVDTFVPTSDGTHTATGTNIVKGTIATPVGAAITSATTDAYAWVNAVPLLGGATDNTQLVNQQTLLSTEYAEVKFGAAPGTSTPTVAPRAVEVIVADRQAATTVGDMSIKLNDNGTESVILARTAAAGVVTDRFTRKHYATPPTGGTWNASTSGNGAFNNLKIRFGYSPDATPDQYWRGAMVEAEFLPVVASPVKSLSLLGVG